MIPKIKKILYATDLSVNSAYALRYAINSAKKHDAHITILHVIKEVPICFEGMLGTYAIAAQPMVFERDETSAMDQIRNRLQVFCDKELKGDPECAERVASIEICKGYPAEEILKKVDELDCDMIVMGAHGKGILRHTFFGNTAKIVVSRVRKPVFLIPLPEEGENIDL